MDHSSKQDAGVIVTFTGGLGAQILSAAIYFDLQAQGRKIFADMAYFDQAARTATPGNKGEISHWDYELGIYDLPLSGFATRKTEKSFFRRDKSVIISDGADKLRLSIAALRKLSVKEHFPVSPVILEECRRIAADKEYLCIHVRRGDYVNVSSHLVDDMDFVQMARSLSRFVPAVVVISDSEVSGVIKESLLGLFAHRSFVIGGSLHVAHALIRQAKYLICSNSQFSLSAALLNEVGQQIFLPTKWYGEGESNLQLPINELCRFQILNQT